MAHLNARSKICRRAGSLSPAVPCSPGWLVSVSVGGVNWFIPIIKRELTFLLQSPGTFFTFPPAAFCIEGNRGAVSGYALSRSPKHRIAPLPPGQSMVARPSNSASLPRSTDRAWPSGTQTPHCSLAPRTSIVARRTDSALLPCSPVRHGHQAHKHRIASPFHGQA